MFTQTETETTTESVSRVEWIRYDLWCDTYAAARTAGYAPEQSTEEADHVIAAFDKTFGITVSHP